jgi:hypothetical protein
MASTKLARPLIGRGSPRAARGLCVLALASSLAPCAWSAQAFAAQSLFFASRQACVASQKFRAEECANAFVNAETERQRNAGPAMSQLDCVRRFHLCELRKDPAGAKIYEPSMLGVEISNSGRGWTVSPVYAVELPPGQIHPLPISHISSALPDALPGPEVSAGSSLQAPGLGETEDVMSKAHATEEAERAKAERRERIRNAPFVE